jgi:hypothetical protein
MNEKETRRMAQNEVWASSLHALRRHLPVMQRSQTELSHGVGQLQVSQGTATNLYAWYGLNALADLHAVAISALLQEHDFGAQALAQDAIHLAVNIVYLLDDPGGDRLTGALRNLLDGQRTRFAAWQAVAPENKEARQRAEQLASDCAQSPWYASAPAWPSPGARADAVGMGEWVHPVLAAATSAEQTTAQELMNFLQCERGSQEERKAAHAYRTARCASDALYVEAIALRLFAHALHRMASMIRDQVAVTYAELSMERMDDVLAEHRRLAEEHRNDTNLYMRVQGNA